MARAARKLKLVDALPADEMMSMLIRDGWQTFAPTAEQSHAHPGTWHVKNPGDPEIYGCRPFTVPHVIKAGGVCRPYHPKVSQPTIPQMAEAVASRLVIEVMKLPSVGGCIDREEVLHLLGKLIPGPVSEPEVD